MSVLELLLPSPAIFCGIFLSFGIHVCLFVFIVFSAAVSSSNYMESDFGMINE